MDASTFYGEDSFTKNTEKLYGIEADKLSDGGILYSSDGNYADEISMLKMADGSSAKSQLADRLSYRLNQYENYKPEQRKYRRQRYFRLEITGCLLSLTMLTRYLTR